MNLCGGTNDPAQATPFGTDHGWGFVADPGTVQNVGELPIITRDLNELGLDLHVTIYGISGYRTPAHSVAVGGYADDPHTKGEAEDIGVNSLLRSSAAQITEAELAKFGLYRPFDPTDDPDNTEVNHVQLIPNGGPVPVTVVDDTFDPDPSCTVARRRTADFRRSGPSGRSASRSRSPSRTRRRCRAARARSAHAAGRRRRSRDASHTRRARRR